MDSTPIFYTDGSLRYPNSVTCRFGAYAIILDTAISDEQRLDLVKNWKLTQAFPFTLTKLAFARVTGEQTIYRAELYAIVCVTEWTPASVIKTDSASVVATFLKCQITHNFHELGQMEEMDLVWRLWNALRQGNHVIHKIKAHQEVNVGHTPLEIYDILGNRYADETAVSAALHFQPEVAQLATQIHAEVTTEQAHLKQFFRLLLDLRQHFAKLQQNEAATAGQVDLQPSNKPSPQQVMGDWSVQEVWVPPPPGVEFFQYSPWGQPTCQLILQWMQLIQWPAAEQIQEGDPGISWTELVLSFTIWAKMVIPLKRSTPQRGEYLQTFDTWEAVNSFAIGLGELSSSFSILVQQVRRLTTCDPWPNRAQGWVRSLYQLGAKNQPFGYKQRPVIPEQRAVVRYLHWYFGQYSTYDQFPPIAGIELGRVNPANLAATWQKGLRLAAKGYNVAKTWRRQPQRGLQF